MRNVFLLCILAIGTICAYGQIPLGHHLFDDNSILMDIRELVYRDDGIYCIAGVQKPDTSNFEYRSYKLDTEDMKLELIDTLVQNLDIRGGYSSIDQSFFELPNGDYFCDVVDLKFSHAILDSAFRFNTYTFIENENVFVTRQLKLANDSTIIAIVEIGPQNSPRDRYIYNYDLDFNVRWRRLLTGYLDFTFFGDMDIIRDSIIVVTQYSDTFNGRSPAHTSNSVHALSLSNHNFINKIVTKDTAGSIRPQIVYNREQDLLAMTVGDVRKLTCCSPDFIHGLLALDSDWNVLWQGRQSFRTRFGGSSDYFSKSISSSDGESIISIGNSIDNGWVLNLSKTGWDGDSIWTRRIVYDFGLENSVGDPRLWDLDASPDGGYVVSGKVNYTNNDNQRRQEGWILKIDSAGCVVAGCDDIVSTTEPPPTGVAMKVFPNPSSDIFSFVIGSSKHTEGIVRIINPQGQVIRQYDHLGNHITYTVSLGDQPSGVYILQFASKNGVILNKLIKN